MARVAFKPNLTLVLALLGCWLAFAVRVINLDARAAHFDEGLNVALGLKPLQALPWWLIETRDNEPLLHRALLNPYLHLAGTTLFAARFFSVWWAVLGVALVFRLLRTLGMSAYAALLGSLALAFMPLVVHHTREAKTYALSTALAALSWLGWVHLAREHHRSAFVGYVLSTAALLQTHYYTALALPGQWLWLILNGTRRSTCPLWRCMWRYVFAQSTAVIPLLVWLAAALPSLLTSVQNTSQGFTTKPLGPFVVEVLSSFASRPFLPAEADLIAAVAFAGALAVGAAALQRQRKARAAFWFGAVFLIVLLFSFALQHWVPFFSPRFLVFAAPHLAAWIGGIAYLPKIAGASAAAMLLALGVVASLGEHRLPSASSLEALRQSITLARPFLVKGDALVGGYIWVEGSVAMYAPEAFAGIAPHYIQTLDPNRVEKVALPLLQAHPRLWLLRYRAVNFAADFWFERWLAANAALAARFGATSEVEMLLFVAPTPSDPRAPSAERRVAFGEYGQVQFSPFTYTLKTPSIGQTVRFTLRWHAPEQPAPHARVFVHLIAPTGALAAQNDGDPLNGLAPNFTWAPRAVITDHRAILIREPLPSGSYAVRIGLYDPNTGERVLSETGADHVTVGHVLVP